MSYFTADHVAQRRTFENTVPLILKSNFIYKWKDGKFLLDLVTSIGVSYLQKINESKWKNVVGARCSTHAELSSINSQ